MTANQTQPTDFSVEAFLASVDNPARRADAEVLTKIMAEVTGWPPVMWGAAIVGFGNYHYIYESGREGDTPVVSFAARKRALTLYGVIFYLNNEANRKLLGQLGPHTTGKGCLYIESLAKIDQSVLKTMVKNAVK